MGVCGEGGGEGEGGHFEGGNVLGEERFPGGGGGHFAEEVAGESRFGLFSCKE